jgi:phytol kinase
MSDWIAIILSFGFVFAALGCAEGLRRAGGFRADFTRKFVHITVGMWSVGTVLLFENQWFAVIPPAIFVILNYISYRQDTFKAIESDDKSNLGTVYFPVAFCLIILAFWPYPALVVAALMPLTWGDAMAAILGKQYGQIKYQVLGYTRSVEGSVSMFLFSLVSTFLALWLLPSPTSGWENLGIALVVALVATLVEAVSPWGLDNLTIPASSGLVLYLLVILRT